MPEAAAAGTPADTGTPAPGLPGGAAPPAPAPWHTGLDAEVLGHIQNKGWSLDDPKTVISEATKAYKAAERHLGAPPTELIRIAKPTDEANYKAMWQKLGAPDKPEGYDFSGVKWVDGTDLEPAFVDTMRASFSKNFVPKETAAEITKSVVKYLADQDASESAVRLDAIQQERAALLKSWGQQAEFNRLQAMQGAKRLGVSAEEIAQLENVVGYSKIMEMFRKVGAGTTEDTFVDGKGTGSPATTAAAQSRLNELMADRAWSKRLTDGGVTERREFESLTRQISGYTEAA